ncbi:Cell cycle control protein 50A [Hondaea fermentalgiana]|uniref:Cell cycle control protein 50A n=1 Tax=Hondaea fermentalgiana TaxID=2315210 RepID=A0A2R5GA09_9STRA|nr:Cell cycle control protein 50A [Hondaea fermentalgiana]|eukprot:GBG24524.1 Cell cycle control protein 50A [Hondaea fermentalgiana]
MANADAAAREGEEAHSNRPENTKFKQQKLDAWQPILTPAWVIGTFIVVGVIFVPVGAYLWKLSDDLFESSVVYDSYDDAISAGVSDACRIGSINEGYSRLQDGSASFTDCELVFEITQDIPESKEVFMYYQISNFYQNHRRYVKSVSDEQLLGSVTINPVTSTSDSTLSTECDPTESFTNDNFESRIFYPCGLIALSVFNDGIQMSRFERGDTVIDYAGGVALNSTSEDLNITLDTSDIAWESDLENKYKNPTNSSCNDDLSNPGDNLCPLRYLQYQYLWQTYDQFLCYPPLASNAAAPDFSQSPSACKDYSTYVNELGNAAYSNWDELTSGQNTSFYGTGCAACEDSSHILVNAGGISPPTDPTSATSSGGVRDERFIVWMRTAGLPTFRKLYGHITPPSGGFKTGDKITLSVIPNFLVSTIEGSKAIVLGTTSPLGGKNDVLGIAYLSVGTICLFLAVVFAAKQRFNPRRLGDPSYLAFGNKK